MDHNAGGNEQYPNQTSQLHSGNCIAFSPWLIFKTRLHGNASSQFAKKRGNMNGTCYIVESMSNNVSSCKMKPEAPVENDSCILISQPGCEDFGIATFFKA